MFSVLLLTVAFSVVHYHAQVQILDTDLSVFYVLINYRKTSHFKGLEQKQIICEFYDS